MAGLHALPACLPLAIMAPDGRGLGIACYLRIDPANGSAEVGGIVMSSALQRTTAATESMYLMMRHVFDDLGYRRYEWKCDSLNEPSRRAAARFGFRYEGRFRNALVYKGRNRDTDWFSVTDDGVASTCARRTRPGWTRRTSTTRAVSAHRSRAGPSTADPGST